MKDIDIKTKGTFRRRIPDEFCKKYSGNVEEVYFKIHELTDEILNTFPIENFDFSGEHVCLWLKVKSEDDQLRIQKILLDR